MASEKLYSIVDSGVRGMVAIATRDIMPGELVVEEKEPLLSFSQADCERYKCNEKNAEFAFAAYNAFVHNLSSEKQQNFMSLYGPTTGVVADRLRKFLQKETHPRQGPDDPLTTLESIDEELMVKAFQVVRFNMFSTIKEDYNVYSEITRFSHSCASNCNYSFCGQSIVCYTRCFIRAGEELTVSYNSLRDMDPIHERRQKYLEVKEFTCHCPRCAAIGDDTRQFDCFDSACKGVMMVCQPINKNVVNNLSYEGVEYVDPHLLPCTVCHQTAPAEYQAEMFALEAKLLKFGPRFAQRHSDMMDERRYSEMEPLYKEVLRLKLPPRHGASLPLLRAKWRVLHCMHLENFPRFSSDLQKAVTEYLVALENICTFPGNYLSSELTFVALSCSKMCIQPVFPPPQEKELCLKALRMHLLLEGRGSRDAFLDEITATCHERLPTAESTDMCTFCEESSQRAFLTLSRCGKCRQVTYCSAGCQKAHWKLHKKTCKPAVGWK